MTTISVDLSALKPDWLGDNSPAEHIASSSPLLISFSSTSPTASSIYNDWYIMATQGLLCLNWSAIALTLSSDKENCLQQLSVECTEEQVPSVMEHHIVHLCWYILAYSLWSGLGVATITEFSTVSAVALPPPALPILAFATFHAQRECQAGREIASTTATSWCIAGRSSENLPELAVRPPMTPLIPTQITEMLSS